MSSSGGAEMKNAQSPVKAESSARNANFTGTSNPRHLRVINALLRRPMPRESLDKCAGCSNGPELVAELRRRGLEVPCVRVECLDRDGQRVRPGVYSFSKADVRKIRVWQCSTQSQEQGAQVNFEAMEEGASW